MKPRFKLLLLFLLALPLLAACSGGYQTTSWPGVTATDQTAYIATGPTIYAINAANGTEQWRFPTETDKTHQFYAPPTLTSDGQLIVGDYGHSLYSLNAENGFVNWVFTDSTYGYMAAVLATDDSIYAVTNNGQVFALTLSGEKRWNASLDGKVGVWAKPVTGEDCGCVYVASLDHHIYALDIENGQLLWQSDGLGGAIVSAPALRDDQVLYAGSFGAQITALDAADGRPVGTPFATDGWVWSSPVYADGQLIFGDQAGNLYILEAEGLGLVQKVTGEDPIIATPLVLTDTIYVTTSTGNFNMFDRDGNPKGTQTFEGELNGPAIQAGNLILLAPLGGEETLIAVDQSGLKQWGFVPAKK